MQYPVPLVSLSQHLMISKGVTKFAVANEQTNATRPSDL